jgi:uncharacterized protein YbjT (DUF2867 family)
MKNSNKKFLVIGGTGKTGRRVVERLEARDLPVRIGSRAGEPPFDWEDPTSWAAVLRGMTHVYVTFYPDLAVPGATDVIRAFTDLAVNSGVQRLVLLSGRGEEEAQKCEKIVQQSGLEWTILRASWFNQNFSEGFFQELILNGNLYFPAGDVREPFIDAADIAAVAVAALTEEGHAGQVYELTGPRLLTFAEAVADIAAATGRQIEYTRIPHEVFVSGLEAQGEPAEAIWLMDYLLTTVLDGRNSNLTDGVQRALGRPPRDFRDYVRQTAASGIWQGEAVLV